jgi:hypothetical protein
MKTYLLAALAALAIGGQALAFDSPKYDFDEYTRGFAKGYHAANPGEPLPYWAPLQHPAPRLGESDFDAGLRAGVERGEDDSQ